MAGFLYVDCFSGASGDMLLGALLDAGGQEAYLRAQLGRLGLGEEFRLNVHKTVKKGVAVTSAHVKLLTPQGEVDADAPRPEARVATVPLKRVKLHKHGHGHDHGHDHGHEHDHEHGPQGHSHEGGRRLPDILDLIRAAELPGRAESIACAAFQLLAGAEGQVHGVAPEQVHFHEVGAVDAIVDIVGVALLIDRLAPDKIVVSPVNVGSGFVRCSHGLMPVPAPATAEILKGKPIYAGPLRGEMCTPTGAALLCAIADEFAPLPALTAGRIGYGAGQRDLDALNAVRVFVCDAEPDTDEIGVLACHIDDMTGEQIAYLMERLMAVGALDVCVAPLTMKKGRPGHALTVMCRVGEERAMSAFLMAESTTLGVRVSRSRRIIAPRNVGMVATPYGDIAIKRAGGRAKPEFESCRAAALQHGASLMDVQRAAMHAAELAKGTDARLP